MDVFSVAAQRFLLSEENQGKEFLGLSEVQRSPSVRILRLKNLCGNNIETYVIKIPYVGKMEVSREWLNLLKNEIEVQPILLNLGFRAKRFLVKCLNFEDIGECYTISTYLPGQTFDEGCNENLLTVSGFLMDYLYKLHSATITPKYGFLGPWPVIKSIGLEESRFLRADMNRDGIRLSPHAQRGLSEAIVLLDAQKSFCLCHCDITLRNAIWDGVKPHLIDWALSRFCHPASDIANVLFWLTECGMIDSALTEFRRAETRYQEVNFSLIDVLPFYLGQRYIEFGRIRGDEYIQHGMKILGMVCRSPQIKSILQRRSES